GAADDEHQPADEAGDAKPTTATATRRRVSRRVGRWVDRGGGAVLLHADQSILPRGPRTISYRPGPSLVRRAPGSGSSFRGLPGLRYAGGHVATGPPYAAALTSAGASRAASARHTSLRGGFLLPGATSTHREDLR